MKTSRILSSKFENCSISLPAKEPSAGLFGSKNLLKYKSRKTFIFGVTTSTLLGLKCDSLSIEPI